MMEIVRLIRCVRATTAVEFALVIGTFIMIVLGAIEFSRMEWAQEGLQETAISGARCVGMMQTVCATNNVVNASASTTFIQAEGQKWGLTIPSGNVTITATTSCGGVSGFSQVSLTYTFVSIVPVLLNLLPAGNTLTAIACFPSA